MSVTQARAVCQVCWCLSLASHEANLELLLWIWVKSLAAINYTLQEEIIPFAYLNTILLPQYSDKGFTVML